MEPLIWRKLRENSTTLLCDVPGSCQATISELSGRWMWIWGRYSGGDKTMEKCLETVSALIQSVENPDTLQKPKVIVDDL